MTRFDHRSQLPKIFAANKLTILPVSRGTYEIGTFETFHDFNTEESETVFIDSFPALESINYREIINETTAINCIYLSKILHDFTGEGDLSPTVGGRMSSSAFGFKINSAGKQFAVKVNNAQVEIDGGYEGDGSLNLIEAKNYISDDFLIRQLYYPYRLWNDRITKRVRPIFLTCSNGIFHLREYEFTDVELYNSIQLVRYRRYAFYEKRAINTETIQKILDGAIIANEPEAPFPQADNFDRVINLCELLWQRGFLGKEAIAQNYAFVPRQADYYANAAKYLGLIRRAVMNGLAGFVLTNEALRIFGLPLVDRQLEFVKLILSHSVFRDALRLYFEKGDAPSKDEIFEIMQRAGLFDDYAGNTRERRAATVGAWVQWMAGLIEI